MNAEKYIITPEGMTDLKSELELLRSMRLPKVAEKLNIPCFLVTHAPFLDKKLRSWKLNLVVNLYDRFVGRKTINKFTKVLAITKWEIPHLLKLGCERDRIICIPNGIPDQFFKQKKSKEENKILFLGRVAPIKNIETVIKALPLVEDKEIKLEIVGPPESGYLEKLKELIFQLNQFCTLELGPKV